MIEKKQLMKNFITYFLLLLVIVIATILRCINLNTSTGLWFDEMVSLYAANQTFPFGIINWLAKNDVHSPLYFLILHLWMNLFGDSDVAVRSLSVLFGVLNVPTIYYVGKEIESKKIGLVAAFFVAINSFLIYYSQEVRFYSLLPCLVSLSILLALRIIKNPNRKNLILLMLTNILVIFTNPIGISFVGFELLIFGCYFYKNDKSKLLKFSLSQIIVPVVLLLFYSPLLLDQIQRKASQFSFAQFKLSDILLYLENWFSPVIDGIYNNSLYYSNFPNYFHSANFLIFTVVPIFIALFAIYRAVRISKHIRMIALICFLTISLEFIAALSGKLCIVCKYTILILPMLLLIVAYGLSTIKNRFLSLFFILCFIFIHIYYMLSPKINVYKIYRYGGYKIPSTILQNYDLSPKDIVFCEESGYFLKRYYPEKYGHVIDYSSYNIPHLSSVLYDILKNKDTSTYKSYFINKTTIPSVRDYTTENIIKKLKKGRYFVIVSNQYNFIKTDEEISNITKNNQLDEKENLYTTVESKILNDIKRIISENYQMISSENAGFWSITIYQNN